MQIEGGCRCGAVRFRCTEAPIARRTCWCRDCQYFAAGSATVNATFRSGSVTVTGGTTVYESVADSGTRMLRHFCPRCGTPLISEATSRPELTIIRVGAFDDPSSYGPGATIWAASAPTWACLDRALPIHGGQPPPSPAPSSSV